MKIFGKLTLGFGTVTLIMLSVLGTVAFQAASIVGFQDVSKKTSILIHRWDTVQLGSYAVLTAPDTLDKVVDVWTDQIHALEAALRDLVEDRRVRKLGATAVEQLENTESLWLLTEANLEETQASLANFKEKVVTRYPILGRGGPDGLQGKFDLLIRSAGVEPQAISYFNAVRDGLRDVTQSNQAFKTMLTKLDIAIDENIDRTMGATVVLSIILIAISLAAALTITLYFSSRISRRAQGIEDAMRRVARRDFSRIPPPMGRDELGLLSHHLRDVVESLGASFSTVQTAASIVTNLKDALSAGSSEGSAAISQISKNIEGIKNQFSVLDSAIAQATDALAEIGVRLEAFKVDTETQTSSMTQAGKDLSQAVDSFAELSRRLQERSVRAEALKRVVIEGGEQVQSTNGVIKSVSHDISNILEIIELIDQISDQTNILSMNAAIESAHAGAAGAGFAVVAEEIRKLAESTQDNAQRIGDSLTSIATKIGTALESSGNSALAIDTISGDITGFALDLVDLASHAAATSKESVQVVSAIQKSIGSTRRFRDGTAEMYERHRAIRDAMENIKVISDESLSGITEIGLGSEEILKSVIHVEEIRLRSTEKAAELEVALRGFKTSTGLVEKEVNSKVVTIEPDYLELGVAVKRPPQNY